METYNYKFYFEVKPLLEYLIEPLDFFSEEDVDDVDSIELNDFVNRIKERRFEITTTLTDSEVQDLVKSIVTKTISEYVDFYNVVEFNCKHIINGDKILLEGDARIDMLVHKPIDVDLVSTGFKVTLIDKLESNDCFLDLSDCEEVNSNTAFTVEALVDDNTLNVSVTLTSLT
jgi:hypothetical protein